MTKSFPISLLGTVREHWQKFLPIWLFPFALCLLNVLLLERVSLTIAMALFWVAIIPGFFWSFWRAWSLVMYGRIPVPVGLLLVFVPFVPNFAASAYLIRALSRLG
jgi:hypothetical protein